MEEYTARYEEYRKAVEDSLSRLYARASAWGCLYKAMSYSLLAGGKRIRPVLALEFARLGGLDWHTALPPACALELMHTASLIHDDLPCMDDDDLRRGQPTCHKAFGETMAVLAADALMIDAFALPLSAPGLGDRERAACALILSRAAGSDGMVGGQVLDTVCNTTTEKDLALTHRMKTGAMLAASCMIGAAAAGGALNGPAEEYGYQIGMAFQIRDDVLDVTGSTEELGKPAGSDKEEGKVTFVDLLGVEGCEKRVRECTDAALAVVAGIDRDGFLRTLAETLAGRKK